MLQDATIFRVLLEFLELDDLRKPLAECHVHQMPLGLLGIGFLVVIGMVFVESGF